MPLKQGTETNRIFTCCHNNNHKKDAPKAGDGNRSDVNPFVAGGKNKKDAPKAGDGNWLQTHVPSSMLYKKDAPKAGDGNMFHPQFFSYQLHKKDAPKAGDGNK